MFTKANVTATKQAYATWAKERAASKVERDAAKARALAAAAEETAEAIAVAS